MRPKLFILFFCMAILPLVFLVKPSYAQSIRYFYINLAPADAVTAGARWRVNGGPWRESGERIELPVSDFEKGKTINIEFNAVTGFVQPSPQNKVLSIYTDTDLQQGRMTAVYEPTGTGTLQVTILPAEVVQAGAAWSIDYRPGHRIGSGAGQRSATPPRYTHPTGTFNNSGALITTEAGGYYLQFNMIPGWVTPDSEYVEIRSGPTTRITKTYTRYPGNLTVTIEPAKAREAGAQWRVDGGAWQNSGSTVNNVAAGQRNIEFKEITGWVKPEALQANLVSNEISRQTGRYTAKGGSVTVTLEPQDAITAGAKWRVGQSAWQDSGNVVNDLTPGLLGIVFKDIDSGLWTTPDTINATITSEKRTDLKGKYQRRSGSLRVTIQQQDAVSAGAQWQVDGGPWQNSGTTISNLLPGRSRVKFKDLPIVEWVTPPEQLVSITSGQNIEIKGDYSRRGTTGIQVNITPHPKLNGAQWRLIGPGQDWKNSGATMSGMMAGEYNVQFKQLDGWTRPPDQRVVVTSNQITPVTGTYTNPYGNLEVRITPDEAVQAGMKWKVGNKPWQNSGYREDQLPIGPCTIQLTNMPDWVLLAPLANINIEPGRTTNVTVSFRRIPGSVTVTVQPAGAVSAGAQWRLVLGLKGGTSTWQPSGATVADISAGQHQVEFKDLAGWNKPATQNVTITSGQTTRTVGEYQRASGSLIVTLQPQEVLAKGAQWRVSGGPWQASGATVSNLSPGNQTVEFKDVLGWNKPGIQNVNIIAGQTTQTKGEYQQAPGSLVVTIQPQEALAKGAQWRVSGGPWQASGATVSNLSPGSQTVEFKDVTGWIKPGSQNVNIIAGQTSQGTGLYRK